MATEIELKVWIDDISYMEKQLYSSMEYTHSYTKHDEYWRKEGLALGNGIRLRTENAGPCTVNWKRKEVRGDIEVNDEHEFSVSSPEEFTLLLSALGFSPWIRKIKRGKAFRENVILAELSTIEGLGDFLELEILENSDDDGAVERARTLLLDCLARLGVSADRIETRYYTQMLAEKGM